MRSNGDKQYRIANLGIFSADVKLYIFFVNSEPNNKQKQQRLMRSITQERARPPGSDKFSSDIVENTERDGKNGTLRDANLLGKEWIKLSGKYDWPTFNEMSEGILLESDVEVRE